MARLTDMTLAEARALGEEVGLAVREVGFITAGSVNSNFVFELDGGGRVFVRVCEESPHDVVVEQNRLLQHLVRRGIASPAPLLLQSGGSVGTHRGKPVVVFPFVSGESLCQARVTPTHARAVGVALARIHLAGVDYVGAPASRFEPPQLRVRIEALRAGAHGELTVELEEALGFIDTRLVELSKSAARPGEHAILPGDVTVIHGDVFRDNVLWDGETLSAILDFESASAGDAIFDLMVTVFAWSFGADFQPDLARALVTGYREFVDLEPAALDSAYDAARMVALRFAVTRLTDYELRPRDVVIYKDFRRFLRRLAAIEAIGRGNFPAFLAGSGAR
ncbi:MAG: homoserine kinase [Myxococcales bacterium]|nr:homoserine kinase [Myxococcales bacterium]